MICLEKTSKMIRTGDFFAHKLRDEKTWAIAKIIFLINTSGLKFRTKFSIFPKENTLNSEEWLNLDKSSECYGPSFSSSNKRFRGDPVLVREFLFPAPICTTLHLCHDAFAELFGPGVVGKPPKVFNSVQTRSIVETRVVIFFSLTEAPLPDPTQRRETDPKQTRNRAETEPNGAETELKRSKRSRNGPKSGFSGWDGRGFVGVGGVGGVVREKENH